MRKLPESAWLEAAIRVAADEYGGPDEDGAYANNIEAIECGFFFADTFRSMYEARDSRGKVAVVDFPADSVEALRGFLWMLANTQHGHIAPNTFDEDCASMVVEGECNVVFDPSPLDVQIKERCLLREAIASIAQQAFEIVSALGLELREP